MTEHYYSGGEVVLKTSGEKDIVLNLEEESIQHILDECWETDKKPSEVLDEVIRSTIKEMMKQDKAK